jgi:hypothetical protein
MERRAVGKAAVGAGEKLRTARAARAHDGNPDLSVSEVGNLPFQKEISRLSIRHGTTGYGAIFQSQ